MMAREIPNFLRYAAKQAASFFLVLVFFMVAQPSSYAQIYSTRATHGIMIDVGTRSVLFEKRSNERMKPASMAKVMTLAVVFDAIRKGELALHDELFISEDAWRRGGSPARVSTMFAEVNSNVPVEDLIRGVAVQSGNDASIALAQGLSGTEEKFAERMNEFARKIGMTNSNFTNSTGLPDDGQYTTPADLATLALYILDKFPNGYKYFGEREFTWNDIRQFNRNPLFKSDIGSDGLKTGFTEESGYGFLGSAYQDNRRLVMVLNGLESKKERVDESRRMLEWGFRSFQMIPVFERNEIIGGAKVYGGVRTRVNVVPDRDVNLLLPKGEVGRISARVEYRGPLKAPVLAGEPAGELVLRIDGKDVQRQPVYTDENIPEGTLQQRALDAIFELAFGWI